MSADRTPCVLHADMDAFYASVEQRDRPELRGRPVVVGGTGGRGVVSAASYEARQFGVHSAMPSAQARKLCPDAVFLPGSMKRYAAESKRIFEVFREFSPRVEGLSLDEAFLDLTGTRRLMGAPAAIGARLRARVREAVDLPISVGIAPVKMVAKIASAEAKPDGLLEVSAEGLRAFLGPLPVRKVWGVGPVAERRLHEAGFRTLADLASASTAQLEATLGEWGLRIAQLARGEDLRDVEPYRAAVSYSEENTFARDHDPAQSADREHLEGAILAHADSVARRLRHDEVWARTVVLKWRVGRRRQAGPRGYPLFTRRRTLRAPSDDGEVFANAARSLLRSSGPEEPVRLIGVGVTNIESRGQEQLQLFARADARDPDAGSDPARRARLNRALDEITDRFGTEIISRATGSAPERAGLTHQQKRGED